MGGVDDGDAAGFAGIEINVVEPDACAGDDAQIRRVIEELLIDDGVGSDDQGVGLGEVFEESLAIASGGFDEHHPCRSGLGISRRS